MDYLGEFKKYIHKNDATDNPDENIRKGSKMSYNSKLRHLLNFIYFCYKEKLKWMCSSREKFAIFFYYSEEKENTYIIFKELDSDKILAYTTFKIFFNNLEKSLQEHAEKLFRIKNQQKNFLE